MSPTTTAIPPVTATTPVVAAGAICWRLVDGKARVLLVHRGQRKDVSLPKGKVDPGESLPQTAVREIQEETGLSIGLGAPLGQVEYTLPNGRPKIVYYWSAEVDEHQLATARFTPGEEIAALEWASIGKARKKLSYEHDIDILDTFAERLKAGRARTFAIIALRHGKAIAPGAWDGPDSTRPLLERGAAEAQSAAAGIAAYRPTKLVTSTAARCEATIAPVAKVTGLPVKHTNAISQDAWEHGSSRVHETVAKRLARRETVVLCSHGPVLPKIISEVGRMTGAASSALTHAGDLATGAYTVLHISRGKVDGGLVAVETHDPV